MKTKFYALFFLFTGIATTVSAQQDNTKRLALVIGVQNYTAVPPLRHSLNDARDMATVLTSKGFKVETLLDPKSKKEIKDAITRYFNTMRESTGAVGIIYYAGHGTQFEGENYLIPAGAALQIPGDMDEQCVKMNTVMSVLNSSDNLNILLLDACRTNAFPSFSRDVVKGLTNVEAPKGSIVVFATQPGTVASDGTGKNGLFTSKLLKYMNEPNLNIGDVLKKVKQEVNTDSEGKQLPSVVDNSLGGDFYFTKTEKTLNTSPVVTAPLKNEAVVNEIKNEDINLPEPVYSLSPLDFGYGPSKTSTVIIGSQVWITQNLNVITFANGDPIPEAKTYEEWKKAGDEKKPAWCYFGNDPKHGVNHGKLYNWYAVIDPRGLAPQGWHIPSDEEWTIMVEYLRGETSAGQNIKSTSGWPENWNGNNKSGFGALPGGYRYPTGTFASLGRVGNWWSSSQDGNTYSWYRYLDSITGKVLKLEMEKSIGMSVRCVKD